MASGDRKQASEDGMPEPLSKEMVPRTVLHVSGKSCSVKVPVHDVDVVIIGSGAAALNAAIHLEAGGLSPDRMVILTDEWGGGTSYNAGSDKQTYYKLSIAMEGVDSPRKMAEDLYRGGAMHGDIALVEAAGSIQEFFHLVQLGVKFPKNEYNVYPGYQTDNDLRQRATSVGPYTSREMVRVLARHVVKAGIPVLPRHQVVEILVDRSTGNETPVSTPDAAGTPGTGSGGARRVLGVVCIDLSKCENENVPIGSIQDVPFKVFLAPHVILATGGPANIYANSVYPENHHCAHGLGIRTGAFMQNLAFMQYGIASVKFRWNLSGSYQQVIPSYVVVDAQGSAGSTGDAAGHGGSGISKEWKVTEVLKKYLRTMEDVTYQTFLKGYQWPFNPLHCDISKEQHSSIVDLVVFHETVVKGHRVFLDFRKNPWDFTGDPFDLGSLHPEAYRYLEASGALEETPIERLERLNPFAIEVYEDHGIDLHDEPLEIQVVVQHCNGGFTGDIWWESPNVRGLFPVGEVNGSHGMHRPGGAALNAGQVGGMRAAERVLERLGVPRCPGNLSVVDVEDKTIQNQVLSSISRLIATVETCMENGAKLGMDREVATGRQGGHRNPFLERAWSSLRARMSTNASIARDRASLERAEMDAMAFDANLVQNTPIVSWGDLKSFFRLRDASITHWTILSAMKAQLELQPDHRPCFLLARGTEKILGDVLCGKAGIPVVGAEGAGVVTTRLTGKGLVHRLVPARPIPAVVDWFEDLLKRSFQPRQRAR